MCHQVNFKFRDSDVGRQPIRAASQNRADAGKQLREGERLNQIIISTEIESFDSIAYFIPSGQKDHSWLATFDSNPAEDCPTIQTWKHDIEQQEIVVIFERQPQTI
jgi:hypothetical protein